MKLTSILQTKLKRKLLVVSLLLFGASLVFVPAFASAATDEWTTSLHDISRDGASSDTSFSTSNVAQLEKEWSYATGAPIASQPAIVNGVAYVGSWNGNEYAFNLSTGAVIWSDFLGTTTGEPDCDPQSAGVSSAPTVLNGVVYVGGGADYWYALNATTGATLWKVYTGDSSAAGGMYNWSSPLILNGYAYIGVASLGDCPLVQGQLMKVNISNGNVVSTLDMVPNGEVGGGIWTSPSYDPTTNRIFVVTGTEQSDAQTYAQAIDAINPDTMTVVDYWHLPEAQAVADSDWTTSAMLFTDSGGRQLVLATDKNGESYAFLRSNLAAGPVWQQQIALGNDCAACGYSTVSSATFGNGLIYQAGGVTTVNGVGYGGSVQAWNPTNGAVVWQHPLTGPVIGAITYMNGMVIDGGGSALEVLNASNGQRLYSYDSGPGNWIYAAPAIGEGTIVTGTTGGTIYAFAMPTTGPLTPPADPNCPTGFTCQDIGNPLPAGSETVSGGTWNISVGGSGIKGASDSFRLMSKPTAGDSQITAQITAQDLVTTSQTGLMIRQSNDPASAYYAVLDTPGGITVQYRHTYGGSTSVVSDSNPSNIPIYLEIQRSGDILTAATSVNGTAYTLVPGATATVIMPYASLVGLAANSGTSGTIGTATLNSVNIGSLSNTPQNTPPSNACPTGWSCSDVGDPLLVGNQSLSGGNWTVNGTGNGIDGSSDQFHYVSQAIAADATATVHIDSQTDTAAAAKAGLMMRANNSPASAYYGAFVTEGSGVQVKYRTIAGLPAEVDVNVSNTDTTPQYLQITRSGATFTTYTSTDGTNWRPLVGSTLTFSSLTGSIQAGYAVTSANANATNNSTADSLSVAVSAPTPPTGCPANWTCEDVGGNTLPAGSQYYSDGVWSILGGGKDLFGTADDFHYVAQNMTGNGTLTTEVTSQGNTDPYAKAGLMVRDETNGAADPSAAYFAILTTPGNGTVVQYRSSEGASTQQLTGVTTQAPIWLRLVRSGNSFTAYTSPDGVTWTAFPGMPIAVNLPATALAGMANTSHSQFLNSTAVFNDFSLVTPNASLPSPWQDADIGLPTPTGSASATGGVFTVSGGGNDIWTTPYANLDQSHYVWQTLNGNGSIIARVTSQTNSSAWAKAGIMIKQSAAANAPYALLAVTPSNGITFQSNFNTSTGGGNYTFPNAWLELTLNGTTVTAYSSADGVHWTKIGSTTVNFSGPVTAGLFVTAHNSGTLSTATFDNVNLATGNSLPPSWTDNDIGNPTPAGSATYSSSVFTINGGGNDIWGTGNTNLDQFNYVSQPMSGDETITARVTSQTNTSAWAKAGIMIKQSTTAGSPYALLAVTPGNGITFQSNFVNSTSGGAYTFPNAWLRLMIANGTVTAYSSADGNTWTEIGTTTLNLTYPATIGLFDCSHNAGTLSTATIDNVSIAANPTLPSPWSDADIGAPTPAGSATYAGSVFTINGGGNDIWGTAGGNLDQFNYVSQPLTNTSETITARVTSQTNSSAWAKAGIMIKQSTTAGSPYALLAVTPGNGITFQYNYNGSVGGGAYTFPNGWLRLSLAAGTVTAYSSANGSTWTKVGSTPLTLTSPATIGLFVCSHNAGALSTATIDNVSLTSP